MPRVPVLLLILLLACGVGCRTAAPPASSGLFDPSALRGIRDALDRAVAAERLPGAVFHLGRGSASYEVVLGHRVLGAAPEPLTADTIFDAASLTKVMATAPAILLLVERGRLDLEQPVRVHLPAFKGGGKDGITVRHLLTHTSGLRAGISLADGWAGADAALDLACRETVTHPPGTRFLYSDINFIVLGELVRRIDGRPLDVFAREEIFQPLGMADTGYRPLLRSPADRIAPTAVIDGRPLRGEVHDPTARRMGGVAGHAGVFTTTDDLARFARTLLAGGVVDGRRVFRAETVALMTTPQSPSDVTARRGLGWDIASPYNSPRGGFSDASYGHTGFTGCALWIDPEADAFWVLLSSRLHAQNGGSGIVALYRELGTLAAEACGRWRDPERVPPSGH